MALIFLDVPIKDELLLDIQPLGHRVAKQPIAPISLYLSCGFPF
jgi:hypothetical protein